MTLSPTMPTTAFDLPRPPESAGGAFSVAQPMESASSVPLPTPTGAVPVGIRHLMKRYGDGPLILEDINLNVQPGEFISLIGPSGCGKSTLLKVIAGLTDISAGEVTVGQQTPKAARQQMAFIFQDANLMPWLRVTKNVELPLRLKGVSAAQRATIARQMVEKVGLGPAAEKFPSQLSGGMRMRVSIARALALSPQILLLDEPFGALDEMTRDHLNEELLAIRAQENFTAFFVTHSVGEAVFLSTRIVVLSANPGRVHTVVEVPFPYPRTAELREDPAFLRTVGEVSKLLRAVER